MENNIFEGAKFGDKFVTKNGYIVIFYKSMPPFVQVLKEDYGMDYNYNVEGKDLIIGDDIVSRYQEPIDEEKLDELAMDFYLSQTMLVGKQYRKHVMDIFKAVYRKVK